jgi:hypothetical protein
MCHKICTWKKLHLLSPDQPALLTAIAQEGVVETPTSMEFRDPP